MSSRKSVGTLKRRALHASAWAMGGHGLSQAMRLGSNLVMTRLLAPEMFGVIAIAVTVSMILALLSDIGLHQNIVQSKRGDDPDFLNTAWVVQILRGGVLWLGALALCVALHVANMGGVVPAQSVYASPVLPYVIAVVSFQAVIAGFQSTKWATASRNFEQKRVTQIELVAQIAALAVMIPVGFATRSIWALVAGGLVSALATTVLSHAWMKGPANRFRWQKSTLDELVRFGKWIFVSSAVTVFAANGDRLMLGGVADASVLGLYAIALLIVGAIEGALTKFFFAISMPALGEIARTDPSRLREIYYKLRLPGDLLLLYMAGLLFAAGQLVIDLLYDARYSEAGGMLEVLALSLIMVRYGVANQTYLAVGIPRYQATINIVRCISLYLLVPVLYYVAGLQAAIWGIALHAFATLPLFFVFNARLGLNNLYRELMVLPMLPIGYLCGSAVNLLYR